MESFKYNILTTMQKKQMLTISGETRYYLLYEKLFLKGVKSHDSISLMAYRCGQCAA
jgi:hypothetical protein